MKDDAMLPLEPFNARAPVGDGRATFPVRVIGVSDTAEGPMFVAICREADGTASLMRVADLERVPARAVGLPDT